MPLPECHPSVSALLKKLRPGLLESLSEALAKSETGKPLPPGITKFSADLIVPKAIAFRVPLSGAGAVVACAWQMGNRWLFFFAFETTNAEEEIDAGRLLEGQNALIELLDLLGSG